MIIKNNYLIQKNYNNEIICIDDINKKFFRKKTNIFKNIYKNNFLYFLNYRLFFNIVEFKKTLNLFNSNNFFFNYDIYIGINKEGKIISDILFDMYKIKNYYIEVLPKHNFSKLPKLIRRNKTKQYIIQNNNLQNNLNNKKILLVFHEINSNNCIEFIKTYLLKNYENITVDIFTISNNTKFNYNEIYKNVYLPILPWGYN